MIWKAASVIFAIALIASNMHEFSHLAGALALAAGALYLAFSKGDVK